MRYKQPSLADLAEDPDYPFYLDPMPNVYFTRDQQAAIGSGMTINRMTYRARRRESLFMEIILKNHPKFKEAKIPVWRDRYQHGRLEGGDESVLSDHVLAVGISQRMSATAITDLAHSLFGHSSYDTILAIAPVEVVTYDRNYVSNDLLRRHGIILHEIRSSELSRGRGGPRCMSCPLVHEDL